MKILVISHSNKDYDEKAINGAWEILPHYFKKLGHLVRTVKKKRWCWYPFIYSRFKPDIVISIGRISGLITAFQNGFLNTRALFVHDLTDHPHFYKSEKRIRYICKNHDVVVTPSKYNFDKYGCDYLLANGSDFKPVKSDIVWDACYLGQIHSFYKINELIKECRKAGIKLKIIHNVPTKDVPKLIAQSKLCVYPISWDSSTKMCDYAAMGKPVVAIKPNLAKKIDYPAHYTTNLAEGIKYLLRNKKLAEKLGKKARKWFLNYAGDWKQQAIKYLSLFDKELNKKIFTMDVERDIDSALDFSRILKKYALKGEFYITGKLVEKHPKKCREIANHYLVGGHGYNHENFAKLSYGEAERIIKKTIDIFRKNKIKIEGWRFPGFKFKNNQLKILVKYGLFDSSIQTNALKNWGKLIFIRNLLSNIKRGSFFMPALFPAGLKERTWDVADLIDRKFYYKRGRPVMHCYRYASYKPDLKEYLARNY